MGLPTLEAHREPVLYCTSSWSQIQIFSNNVSLIDNYWYGSRLRSHKSDLSLIPIAFQGIPIVTVAIVQTPTFLFFKRKKAECFPSRLGLLALLDNNKILCFGVERGKTTCLILQKKRKKISPPTRRTKILSQNWYCFFPFFFFSFFFFNFKTFLTANKWPSRPKTKSVLWNCSHYNWCYRVGNNIHCFRQWLFFALISALIRGSRSKRSHLYRPTKPLSL